MPYETFRKSSPNTRALPAVAPPLILGAALLLAAPPLPADHDELRLRDGRVLYGDVSERGDRLTVETRDGKVVLDREDVVARRDESELRAEIEDLAERYGDAPHAALELARLAQRYHLEDLLWRHLDTAVTSIPATGTLRDRLHGFLATLEPELLPAHRRCAILQRKVEELLARVRPDTSPGRIAAIEALLASLQDERTGELLVEHARHASRAQQRRSALKALLARDDGTAADFVWRTAIVDPSPQLRSEVLAWAQATDSSPDAVAAIAPGLGHRHPKVLERTAAALGELRDPAALAPLVAAGPRAAAATLPGGSSRAHVAFIRQQAYVRDFDVEVAQAAFIADPQIDVLQSGTVLDVTVHSVATVRTELVRVLRGALHDISGSDPGGDVDAWSGWLESLPRTESTSLSATASPGGTTDGD